MLNQNIDEDQAKSTAQLRSYKFDMEKVWPEDETVTEATVPTNTSTPLKPQVTPPDLMSIPLYKRLLADNSFNSSLDEDIF